MHSEDLRGEVGRCQTAAEIGDGLKSVDFVVLVAAEYFVEVENVTKSEFSFSRTTKLALKRGSNI